VIRVSFFKEKHVLILNGNSLLGEKVGGEGEEEMGHISEGKADQKKISIWKKEIRTPVK